MKPKFIQENCNESNKTDLRQARVVAHYQPDIILFELPAKNGNPALIFNRYSPAKKPLKEVEKIKTSLKIAAKKYPYALSDVHTWENIEHLWRDGHNVLLFNIDGPDIIRRDYCGQYYGSLSYDAQRHKLIFWAHCYLREIEMADHLRHILKNYRGKQNPVIAVFLQSIHWWHVKFLLTNPSQKEIWKYYFGRFHKITPANIAQEIKKKSVIQYAYWEKVSPFRALKNH